ncbi:MAG: tRNA (N(6)-L-threonylcarbamoyladenosine(37)-C(2))-methylthiotransferase MtaB [Bacilli bacterium]
MKVNYYSLGCKVNEYESLAIINDFVNHGYELVSFDEPSDVCIINTCTVTAHSDAKSRKIIRHAIKQNPQAIIAVMGCFSQLHMDEVKSIPGVHVIVGTSNRHLLFSLVENAKNEKQNQILIEDLRHNYEYEEIKISRFINKSRGFIKIEDGCDNYCSYCAIPYSRGHVRSRKPENVISEIAHITDLGVKEIVLTGINTGAYGKDLNNYDLADLLEDIIKKVPNLGRIRISSIETTEITPKLLKIIQEDAKYLCNHFHIPLQGGNDKILGLMNRKYHLEQYQEKINQLRLIKPLVNITTDIIAGFSGENNEDFQNTLSFIKKMNFGEMHVFPYSRRVNTKAFSFLDVVDEATKKYRVNELLALNSQKALEYRKKFEGKEESVIVEKIIEGIAFGHTSNYLEVQFPTNNAQKHELVKVIIREAGYPISQAVEVPNV